jgi:hypothetical protein
MADLEFYKSNVDEWDADNNGGDIDDKEMIESGVANALMLDVRPATAEDGGVRYFKFFVKATVDTITLGFDISRFTDSEKEEVYLFRAGSHEEVESDLNKDNLRLYGGFLVTNYDADNKTVTADRDVSEFVKADDKVTFYLEKGGRIVSWVVDSVDGADVVFKDTSDDDISGAYASSSITLDALDTDDYVGFWIKEVIPQFSTGAYGEEYNSFEINIWYDVK